MIVHVFNSGIVSGPETLVLPALAELNDDVKVIFLTETRLGDFARRAVLYAKKLGLSTVEISVSKRLDLWAIEELTVELEALQPDVVHAHDVKASTYVLRAARQMSGLRPVLFSTHHGVRGRRGLRVRLYEQYYTRCVLPHFDRVLTVCRSDRDLLVARGLSPEQVRVHLNGVDRLRVNPASRRQLARRIRESWRLDRRGIASDSVIVGFVGRLAPEKRIDKLLRALAEINNQAPELPDWNVLMFGSGPLERRLKRLSHRLGLDDRVHWMGYRTGLGQEMAGFDLLVSLSDAEGLPINLVEAGWAATAVVATAVDGNLDLIPSEQFGQLVGPGESIQGIAARIASLIRDEELRGQLGEEFQALVTLRFSGERWKTELTEFYGAAEQS